MCTHTHTTWWTGKTAYCYFVEHHNSSAITIYMYIKLGIVTQFSIYETFCDGVRIVWRNGEWGGVLQ